MTKLPEELMSLVNGGKLPPGWEKIADKMAPGFIAQYGDVSWEEALNILSTYVTDPEDYEKIKDYMKKYFPDQN